MIYQDIDRVSVTVYDKVREYYRVEKKLAGLIKVFKVSHADRAGRTVEIVVPQLDHLDEIRVNGIEYIPKGEGSE